MRENRKNRTTKRASQTNERVCVSFVLVQLRKKAMNSIISTFTRKVTSVSVCTHTHIHSFRPKHKHKKVRIKTREKERERNNDQLTIEFCSFNARLARISFSGSTYIRYTANVTKLMMQAANSIQRKFQQFKHYVTWKKRQKSLSLSLSLLEVLLGISFDAFGSK